MTGTLARKKAIVGLHDPYAASKIQKSLCNDFDVVMCDASMSDELILEEIRAMQNLNSDTKVLLWLEYELLPFSNTFIQNAYCIRKSLIRKTHLAHTLHLYTAKHPESILHQAILSTVSVELDGPDCLDELLMDELWEVSQGGTFILKPGMGDGGYGIRVFNSVEALYSIISDIYDEEDEEDEMNQEDGNDDNDENNQDATSPWLSGMREWVVQKYLTAPMMLPVYQNRKFHLRVYVLFVASLSVYVFDDILVLFASQPFSLTNLDNPHIHLTNTCVQNSRDCVFRFHETSIPNKSAILSQIKSIVHDVVEAMVAEPTKFQTTPTAFELFGFDFLVDAEGLLYFLEANAFPGKPSFLLANSNLDFKQTGDALQDLIQTLFNQTTTIVLENFYSPRRRQPPLPKATENFHLVYHQNLYE